MNTIATTANAVTTYFERLLLERAHPVLLHQLFGKEGRIALGMGNIIKWVRVNSLPAATTPLGEGVDPTADTWAKTEVTATLAEYGGLVKNSSLKLLTEQDVVLNDVVAAQGEQAGDTLDQVCRDVVNGGTSVVRAANVGARTDIITKVAKTDLDRAVMQLGSGNARRFTGYEFNGPEANTSPIGPAYIALCHEHLRNDIVSAASTSWTPAEKYGPNVQRLPGEIGYYNGVRFLCSTNAKIFAAGGADVGTSALRSALGVKVDVYSILMLGVGAFGIARLAMGSNVQVILKTPEQAGSLANRFGSSAWIALSKCAILNENFMCRLEVGAAA